LDRVVPVWLRDRPGLDVGYRFLWSSMAVLDALADILLAGRRAAMPGMGEDEPGLAVTSALPLVGASRGLIRGEDETEQEFSERLRAWLDLHRDKASQEILARVVQSYVAGSPRVRVIQRGGGARGLPTWYTLESDGTLTVQDAAWDWDSVSHPERNDPANPWWSDLWVIVYASYDRRNQVWGTSVEYGGDPYGLGHLVTRESYDALRGLLQHWKAAHTRIRAVIFADRLTDYAPDGTGITPDGSWGSWGTTGSGARVPSGRDRTYSRYWELP
jgi:hypothetical protein